VAIWVVGREKNLAALDLLQAAVAYIRFLEPVSTISGCQVIGVVLKDGRRFDQVVASEGLHHRVRGYEEIPFPAEEIESVIVNQKNWNFRDGSDIRIKYRAATA